MIRDRYSDITITVLPPMRVACYRAVSHTPEDDATRVLGHWLEQAGLRGRSFGFDSPVDPEQEAAGLRGYELWVAVPPGTWPSPPVSVRDFAGGPAAALTIHRPFDDPFRLIPEGWHQLATWAAANGHDPAAAQCLEEVVGLPGEQDMILYLMLA